MEGAASFAAEGGAGGGAGGGSVTPLGVLRAFYLLSDAGVKPWLVHQLGLRVILRNSKTKWVRAGACTAASGEARRWGGSTHGIGSCVLSLPPLPPPPADSGHRRPELWGLLGVLSLPARAAVRVGGLRPAHGGHRGRG